MMVLRTKCQPDLGQHRRRRSPVGTIFHRMTQAVAFAMSPSIVKFEIIHPGAQNAPIFVVRFIIKPRRAAIVSRNRRPRRPS